MRLKLLQLTILVLILISCNPDEMSDNPSGGDDQIPSWGEQTPLPVVNGEESFTLTGPETYVNVMKNSMPRKPKFPSLKIKEGKMIGFVADLSGKPLKGAHIGVRSSAIGGSYSSAMAETDDNGYYEILIPWGAAEIWAAGYSFSYGTGKAAMGLYPEDGKTQSFESTKGIIKNFVLLSYGLADEDERAERPWSSSGYFGGSILISYNLGDPGDIWAPEGSLPYTSEIIIKLTPIGETLYGEAKSFTIIKKVESLNFTINNIPIGKYSISAKLKDGRELKIRQIGPYVSVYPHHGLKPKEAVGSSEVYFTPMSVDAKSGGPNHGGWRPVDIRVQLP